MIFPTSKALSGIGLIAVGLFGVACVAVGQSQDVESPISCGVTAKDQGRNRLFETAIQASDSLSGTYQLQMTISANGNRTSLRQGGPFTLQPGEIKVLSSNRLNAERDDVRYALSVNINGQTYDCPGAEDMLTLAPARVNK